MDHLATALTDRLARQFSNNARRQGFDYAQLGRVKIHEGTEKSVDAAVTGTEIYGVTLALEEHFL